VQGTFPGGTGQPEITPMTSPIGTIIKYALTTETTSLMEVRRIVDGQMTNRLRAVSGVTRVVIIGGDVRQYQVLIDPMQLQSFNLSLAEVSKAIAGSNNNAAGGFLTHSEQELLIRGLGRIASIEQLQKSVIAQHNGIPVLLSDVADVTIGAAPKRGNASLNGQKAIVITIESSPLLTL
jgi:Cu/Ag efflux pump CusA